MLAAFSNRLKARNSPVDILASGKILAYAGLEEWQFFERLLGPQAIKSNSERTTVELVKRNIWANSETFSHVKITSTQVIARLKARKKLSLMILLADFRGSEKRVAHALKNKKRNALVPLFYGFTRFLPYTVLTELIMLLSIPVANFQVRYTRSPKHKNWV